eukprot:Pgem_evm3s16798
MEHMMYGHIAHRYIKHINSTVKKFSNKQCDICVKSKLNKKKVNKQSETHPERYPGQLLYIDTKEWDEIAYGGTTDAKTSKWRPLFSRTKEKIKEIIDDWVDKHNEAIKLRILNNNTEQPSMTELMRFDYGTEYINEDLFTSLEMKGIFASKTPKDAHQYNNSEELQSELP